MRVLVASADVNLKRQMITSEAEKIMWYYSLRYQYLIRHIFYFEFRKKKKGELEGEAKKPPKKPKPKTSQFL